MRQYSLYTSGRAQRLSLDRPATYQITIQGRLGPDWSDWFEGMTITPALDQKEAITILTGLVTDQAALHGLLNRLYGLGLPLLSITCLDVTTADEPGGAESSSVQPYPQAQKEITEENSK